MIFSKAGFLVILLLVLVFGVGATNILAQDSPSVLYVPIIGITSVPEPLALPSGEGNVTYQYAVKNFLAELPLSDIRVIDDSCSPVKYVQGDDNKDSRLDKSETWRYVCTTKLAKNTKSTATATGTAGSITATHQAFATVVVGTNNPPPLVSVVNTTKIANPFSGGEVNFTYKVTNPGIVPLSDVTVTDNKCHQMSSKLGDTNSNNLLDVSEVWIYSCTTNLTQTITATVAVTALANGLKAESKDTLTVQIDNPVVPAALFDVGISPVVGVNNQIKFVVWGFLSGILTAFIVLLVFTRKGIISKI